MEENCFHAVHEFRNFEQTLVMYFFSKTRRVILSGIKGYEKMLRLSRTSGRKLHSSAAESSALRERGKLSEKSEWFWKREATPPALYQIKGRTKRKILQIRMCWMSQGKMNGTMETGRLSLATLRRVTTTSPPGRSRLWRIPGRG